MKIKKVFALLLAACLLFALAGCAAGGATADTSSSMISSVVMLAALFAMMYFVMIRPERKRKKEAEEMRNSVEVGDKITTIGGIVGRVVHVSEDRITFETGEDRVRLEVTKWALSSNEGKGKDKKEAPDEPQA